MVFCLPGIFAFLFFLWMVSSAFPQNVKLLEAAKEEGKVTVYGSLEYYVADEIKAAFQKQIGIRVDYWRAAWCDVTERVLNEYRDGNPAFDVVLTNTTEMRVMLKEGVFADYKSPSAKDLPRDSKEPQLGPRYRGVIIGIVYNKNRLKSADAPRSLDDLLKPQFRGKLVMPDPSQHSTTTQWLASLYKIMGKAKADKFIRDLAATKPILEESLMPAAERVGNGDAPIAITYLKYILGYPQNQVPLDYVRVGKMLGEGHHMGLSKKAPRPNAGKAFIDFFLGDESMSIMAKHGAFVSRKGIYPPLPDADKVQFVQMDDFDADALKEKQQEYGKIFLHK